ncbi:hypothetical protein L6J37_02365 [Photobacterium sp. WH77]|uniref:glycosyltransferase n=1 Tax=unclassified Photobacterium TaxID=2628852 RepID=UPI001EDC1F24|nr:MULTISPECIES: glycosyltransferase [unclassified Photobacterium]MCG2835703.1 hypothetical protein [Photobacterium sp. WH77]MCG2843316.1 hypothetical protein [Photobacterium sp. WH80]
MNNIILLYSGISLNCAPRVESLVDELKKKNLKVRIGGVVKQNDLNQDYDTSFVNIFNGNNAAGKLVNVIVAYLNLIFCLYRNRNQIDLIYAINPISGLAAYFLFKLTGTKYVYETQEIFIGTKHRFFTGRWKPLWFKLESMVARSAQKFIATDQYRMKFLRRLYKINYEKCDYLYNTTYKNKYDRCSLRNKHSIDNEKYIVSYCGAIIKNRSINEIMIAFKKANLNNSILYMVGYFDEKFKIELDALVDSIGLTNVVFTGKVDNNTLKEYMALSNVTFALYESNCVNNRLNSPNKLFDAIMCKVSLITTQTFLSNYLSRFYECVLIKENNVESITQAIKVKSDFGVKSNSDFSLDNLMPKFVSRLIDET